MEGFGERLRKKREELGLSQTDLAKIVGYKSYKSISEWEGEKQTPPLPILPILAKALHTTPNYLVLGVEEKNYELIEQENQLLKEVLHAYRKAEKAEKELEQSKNYSVVPE